MPYVSLSSLDSTGWPEEFVLWYEKRPAPYRGGRLNDWLLVAARKLKREVDRETAKEILRPIVETGGGERGNEIERQVNTGYDTAPSLPKIQWPKIDEVLLAHIGPATLQDLMDASPCPPASTEEVIDTLFPGNPLLCAGPSKERAITKPREEFRGLLSKLQFIVPSSPSRPSGKNQEGRAGRPRCNEMFDDRHYLVVEFDQTPLEDQPRLILYLAKSHPLRLVVWSAGKSLHSWFDIRGWPEAQALGLMRLAVSLGADRTLWTKCQLVRMPDGIRADNGKRQHVIFYDRRDSSQH